MDRLGCAGNRGERHAATGLLILGLALAAGGGVPAAEAQEAVHFTTLAESAVQLDGYLYRPAGERPHPAVVFPHGCGGLFLQSTGAINKREQAWAADFVNRGYVVLMVDSFRPRGIGAMCAPANYNQALSGN